MANVNFYWNPKTADTTWAYINPGVQSNWTSDAAGTVPITASPYYPGDTGTPGNSVIYIQKTPVPTTGPASDVIVAGYICNQNGVGFGGSNGILTKHIVVNLTAATDGTHTQAPTYGANALGNENPVVSILGNPGDVSGTSWAGKMYNWTGLLVGGPANLPTYPCKMYGYSLNYGLVANLYLYDYATNQVAGNWPSTGVLYEYLWSVNAQHIEAGCTIYSMLSRSDRVWLWPSLTDWIMVGQDQ